MGICMTDEQWWKGAVIYQVYPRSFMDSNGDGVGDLRGIVEKMDYLAGLAVDAIWISPFFTSPMKDFGYDISDYRAVDPLFGSLADFDRLIEAAHAAGIKVIIDQVLSHTSDQHAWFQQSRSSRDNARADWYIWADPKADGTPPNNWLSIFGGSAWQWDSRRRQYFMHNFLDSQPDLNFHNPELRAQILEEVEFWLQRGVDGLRLDAINFCFHDRQLRDNPAKPEHARKGRGFSEDNPYAAQYHIYDNTRPENLAFLQSLRALLDRYPGVVSLGEISSEQSIETMAEYTAGDSRLHMAYSFELLVDTFCPRYIRATVESFEANLTDGWPCWSLGNHDVKRVLTRWGGDNPPAALAKMLTALLCSLRGSVCCYQGEELGLPEADIAPEQIQDPYGVAFWPMFKGRDGCRTPLPWTAGGIAAGFSAAEPWLPTPDAHRQRAVDLQSAAADSVLNAYRRFMRWRRQQPALRLGDIAFTDAPEGMLVFSRRYEQHHILAGFNLSDSSRTISLPPAWTLAPLSGHGFAAPDLAGNQLTLQAYGACFAQIVSA